MNIGEASRLSGLPSKTIRYYESVGLIETAGRSEAGYRVYDQAAIETLRFVHRARSLGFTVAEVGDLLALWRDKKRASAQVKALAAQHLARIDEKIAEFQGLRGTLVTLIDRCQGDDRPDCPILSDLAGEGGEGET